VAGGVLPVTAAEPLLSRPRYLRLPERGPPGLVWSHPLPGRPITGRPEARRPVPAGTSV